MLLLWLREWRPLVHTARSEVLNREHPRSYLVISRTCWQMNKGGSPAHSVDYENTRHASRSLGRLRWEAAQNMSED